MKFLSFIYNLNFSITTIIAIIGFITIFPINNIKSKNKKRKIIINLLWIGTALFVLAVFSTNIVEVPNVVGLDIENAKQTLNEQKLLFYIEDGVDKSNIVEQQFPVAGEYVYVNYTITLYLQNIVPTLMPKQENRKPITMPALHYVQEESALELLYNLGAGEVEVNYVFHDDINAGLVLDTTPSAGETFNAGDVVVITVSQNRYEESKLDLSPELYENFKIDGKKLLYYLGDDSVVVVPEGIEIIGKAAFTPDINGEHNYNNITRIVLPDSVKIIESSAFCEMDNLEFINIPDSVKGIPAMAFRDCINLQEVDLPNDLMYIGGAAFFNCNSLKSLSIPKGVEYIGAEAFCQSGLNEICLPKNVRVGEGAFLNCKYLEQIYYEDNIILDDGCFAATKWLDNNENEFVIVSNKLLKYNGESENIIIPDNIEIIDAFAFVGNKTLKTVKINDNVKEIGDQAFWGCANLREVEIANSISTIGSAAFMGTEWLESFPNDFVIVGDSVLISYKGNEKEISIPKEVKIIGRQAFSFTECTKISIPSSVEKIDSAAFMLCNELEEIELSDNIAVIPDRMCYLCPKLKIVDMPQNLVSVGEEAFSDCVLLENISLPGNVKIISPLAFNGCSNLKSVEIDDECKYICYQAFNNCLSLEYVYMPKALTKIGDYAFFGCTKLREVTINYGIKYLGEGTFAMCTSLQSISLPMSVIELGLGSFMDCYNLQSVKCCGNIKEIKFNTFRNCKNLLNIKLPTNLEKIGVCAFEGCSTLKNITFSDKIKIIGEGSFYGSGLEEVTIPGSVKFIDRGAFYECYNLKTVKMREGVEEILTYAFGECGSLQSIYFPDSISFLGDYIGGNENTIFYCNKDNMIIRNYANLYKIKTRDF